MDTTTSRRTTRVAVASVATALVLGLAAAPALAAGDASPSPTGSTGGTVTITVDAQKLARLCDTRIPTVLNRAQSTLDRIQGSADTHGSAAWLQARAAAETAKGHDDRANRLTFRAQRRLGHVDEITSLMTRLRSFESSICSQVGS
jgi:hypothetical protein